MASTISNPVGEGGRTNRHDADVKTVMALLNAVDPASGGPSSQLTPAWLPSARLIDAIRAFQMRHFACATGRVEPGSLTLDLLNAGGVYRGESVTRRLTILWRTAAVTEGRKLVGRTSYRPADQFGNPIPDGLLAPPDAPRHGWQVLQDIFKQAGLEYTDEEFQQFKSPKKRGPDAIGWCGLYCTWALVQAGHKVLYKLAKGISVRVGDEPGPMVPLIHPDSGQPARATIGDVCVVKDTNPNAVRGQNTEGYLFHHVLMASEPDAAGNFETLEGNFPNTSFVTQCVVDRATSPRPVRNLSEIFYHYDLYRPASL